MEQSNTQSTDQNTGASIFKNALAATTIGATSLNNPAPTTIGNTTSTNAVSPTAGPTLNTSTNTVTAPVSTTVPSTTVPIQTGSPLATYASTPNTPANMPSSSSSVVLNSNANSASTSLTNPPVNPNAQINTQIAQAASSIVAQYSGVDPGAIPNASDITTKIQSMVSTGTPLAEAIAELTPDPSDLASLRSAYTNTQSDLQEQSTQYQQTLATNDSDFANALNILKTNQAAATAAMVGKLRVGGQANAGNVAAVTQSVGQQYAALATDLATKAADAANAAAQGNTDAVQKIKDSYQTTLTDGLKSIAANVDTITKNFQTSASLTQNDQNRATSQYNTSLSNLTSASPINSLFDSGGQPVAGALTSSAFLTSSAYQQGTDAGLSPQAILSDMQNAVKTSKANDKLATLQIDSTKAQIEEYNSEIAANTKVVNSQYQDTISSLTGTTGKDGTVVDGSAYNDAVASIASFGKMNDSQQNQLLSNVATALVSGNTTQAQNVIKAAVISSLPATDKATITGLETVASTISTIKTLVASLPADEQSGIINGNIQDLATKFGANPDPKLQQLGVELGHLKGLYVSNVFGKRAVINNSGFLSNLIPDDKDGASLMYSDLDGLQGTANDYTTGTMQTVLDSDTYNSVFNGSSSTTGTDSGVSSSTGSSGAWTPLSSSIMNMVNSIWNNSTTSSSQ